MTATLTTGAALSPKQEASIADATARINVWHGAVRSGKTIASIIAWLDFIARAPGDGKLAMIGKTKDTIARNVIDPMADMLGEYGRSAVIHTRGAGTAVVLGRLVEVLGAHDAKSESRIRGMTLRGAYIDEASLVPEAFWRQTTYRLSLPGARLFATTNPDNPRHWLKRDWLDADGLDLASWHFRLDDNPGLEPHFVEQLKAENVGLWALRFIDGLWVAAQGAVFPMLRTDKNAEGSHVVDELPAMSAWHLAVDYGATNPFHALLIGEGTDERLYVAREWRWDPREQRRDLTDAEYADRVGEWVRSGADGAMGSHEQVERVWIDPSAKHFITHTHRDGWSGHQAADNAVVDGIRDVGTLLGLRRLLFHSSCRAAIDEHTGYVWDEDQAKRGVDAPRKVDDHSVDACRYAVRGLRSRWRHWVTGERAAA